MAFSFPYITRGTSLRRRLLDHTSLSSEWLFFLLTDEPSDEEAALLDLLEAEADALSDRGVL